jgi:hypothetical protein
MLNWTRHTETSKWSKKPIVLGHHAGDGRFYVQKTTSPRHRAEDWLWSAKDNGNTNNICLTRTFAQAKKACEDWSRKQPNRTDFKVPVNREE